jgi:hypothetical protein
MEWLKVKTLSSSARIEKKDKFKPGRLTNMQIFMILFTMWDDRDYNRVL